MPEIVALALPLPHPGSVNAWLLRGDPLTLVDTGPASPDALHALELGLARHRVALEDVELVLATHHHVDHVGLAGAIRERSGAQIAVLEGVADYAARYHDRVAADRAFSQAVMAAHGVPREVIDGDGGFWRFLDDNAEDFVADRRLRHGEVVRAGGRDLRVVFRPGHSTTDTLLVDDDARLAFVGDHLLADVSSNTEMYPACGAAPGGPAADARPRSRLQYLDNLRATSAMPLERLLTGHGRPVTDHAALVEARLLEHRVRADRIAAVLDESGPATAFDVARSLWRPATVLGQPLLVVWEVLGHLDLLAEAGAVTERVADDGRHLFAHPQHRPRSDRLVRSGADTH